ncbi:hypothetical protein HN747_02770 [archaeon]|jgi:hypothetical protein|nr:hypothetical protein [archaeon]
MNPVNVDAIAKSRLILEFTGEVFESFKGISFNVPKREVIDTSLVPKITPTQFRNNMQNNLVSQTAPVAEGKTYYVESAPQIANGMLKIQGMLNDPSVAIIECQGPNTPLVVSRRGVKQFTRISLTQAELEDILDDFTNKARIPLIEGIVHLVVGNFEVNGVYSELVRSNFIITRV